MENNDPNRKKTCKKEYICRNIILKNLQKSSTDIKKLFVQNTTEAY